MFKKGYKQTPEHTKKIMESRKGYIVSEETKKKISIALKGIKFPNRKSSPFTKEHRENISKAMKGKMPKNIDSIKGWNKGIPRTLETRKKLSIVHIGIFTKEKHPRWKGGCRAYYGKIARALYSEHCTNIICDFCGTSEDIHIHHKDENWINNVIENLQPLCRRCHSRLHNQLRKKGLLK